MRDRLIRRIAEWMRMDDRVVFITGDLGFGVIEPLRTEFPDRFVNGGVSEQNILGVAAGMALEGLRPCVYSIANFPTLRALQQLRNDICYHRLPVTVIAIGGGLGYGPLGPSHHASDDLGALLAIPGLAVLAPATLDEVDCLGSWLVTAEGPSAVRIDRGPPASGVPLRPPTVGATTPMRCGDDLAILTYGNVLTEVLLAADLLARDGIEATVDTAFALRPFDCDRVVSLATAGPVLVVEEHCRVGGLTTTVAQLCAETGTPLTNFRALTLGDDFVREVGSTGYLRQSRGLDHDSIHQAARSLIGPSRP